MTALEETATPVAATLAEIDRIIDESGYVKHSFTRSLLGGDISSDGLRDWAVQKYFQTYEQNRGFSAIHSISPYEDVRQWQIGQLIAEETTLEDGSDAHYRLMARFARAIGAQDADFDRNRMAPQVGRFIDYLMSVCRDRHFVYGLLAFYVNERQTPAAAQKMFDHLTNTLGISDHDAEWFSVHGEVDVHHSEGARRLIAKYATEAPDFETEALVVVREGIAQWQALQDFYYGVATGAATMQAGDSGAA
ncbi:TenA family transcriptional regulator [Nocardia sp. CDC160]|uniref:TenA family transcriptional regulator n=1 Tax=Nocardia sp. CDC160 TaxID=3112166 RepID=UPI002DBDC6DF|nr:iron-containing redox enzyme family protein [Nocardia sp. CDC160]MEC3919191.1 iron-containing redox enzyme family protein [Nocardia sp. CDC160]